MRPQEIPLLQTRQLQLLNTITGTNTVTSCSNTVTQVITVNPLPTVSIGGTTTICNGSNTTLTASGANTYVWTGGPSTAGYTVSPTTNTSYTVTGTTTATGCINTSSVSVTVQTTPTVTITGTSTICDGSNTTLTASGANTYTWTGGPATATYTVSPATTTTYTVTGTNTADGCTNTATQQVKVNALPSVTISGTTTICDGANTTLTANGANTYLWTGGPGTASYNVSPTTTTTYTVTGTNTSTGCINTATQAVTVNSLPIVTISGTTTICDGGNTNLTANGANSYTWSPLTGLNLTTGASVTASPTSNTTYTITGTNTVTGCSNTVTQLLTVNPTPTITVSPDAPTLCTGGNVTLTAGGISNYTWNTGATTSTINVSPTATTTYTLNGSSSAGCTGTAATATVTVASSLNVFISPAAPSICNGDSVTLNGNGAATFTWKPATGLSCTACASPVANPTVTITYTVIGTSGVCSDSAKATLTVNPTPTVTALAGSASICAGNSTSINAGGATSYTWLPSTGLNSTTGASVTASPTATTTYTVTGTNSFSCSSTAVQIITINPLPALSIGGTTTICNGSGTLLTASGANTYIWTSGPSTPSYSVTPTTNTTYTVTGTNTVTSCSNTISQLVTVNATPTVSITGTSTICNGAGTTLTASGANTYSWSGGPATATYSVTPTASTTYSVTGTNTSDGCTNTATQAVTVNPLPVISIGGADSVCSGSSTTLTASGGNTYVWNTGITTASYSASPTANTTYTVTGTNTVTSCSNTASQLITVIPLPSVIITTSNTSICNGGSTTLTASGANTYVWTGGPSTPSYDVSPTINTTYTVTGTNTVTSCSNSSTQLVTVNSLPLVTITGATSLICNKTDLLTANVTGSSPFTFNWSTSGTNDTVIVKTPNTYSVTVTDKNSCSSNAGFVVNSDSVPAAQICVVSVDTGSVHNVIVWDKAGLNHVDSLKIYYLNSASVWQLIKELPFSAPNYFVDTLSINNPNANTVRYDLTAVDSCGNEEPMSESPWQNTMYINQSPPGTFIWSGTGYLKQGVALPVITYYLYRDSISNGNWVAIDSISGTQNKMSDAAYLANPGNYTLSRWRVEAKLSDSVNSGGCTLPNLRPQAINNTGTRSNTAHFVTFTAAPVLTSKSGSITVYPNPSSNGVFTVQWSEVSGQSSAEVYNVLGEKVYSQLTIHNSQFTINLENQPSGVYFVKVTSNTSTQTVKLIIQK
ncbi:MAG: T9SS type A sorting domain-containing protein [Bacteroidia bacterium]